MSGVFACGPKLPLSQRSKFANSSLRDSDGWVSPSPFICVTSYSGSHFMRVSAYVRSRGLFEVSDTSSNISPFDRLPLCGIASRRPPVFCS